MYLCVLRDVGFTWKKAIFIIVTTTLTMTLLYHQHLKPAEITWIPRIKGRDNYNDVISSYNTSTPLHFLCHNIEGRMGNAMFRFASAYGIARSLNMRPVMTGLNELKKNFQISPTILEDNSLCRNFPQITENKGCSYDGRFKLVTQPSFIIKGFLQSWYYFKSVDSEIRQQFQFKTETVVTATKRIQVALLSKYGHDVFQDIRSGNRTIIGLHVRRGDQLNNEQYSFGVRVPDKSFIPRAQNFYRDKFPNVTFLVCSDDFNWTKTATDNRDDVIFMEGNSPEVDMCIIAHTNHTVYTIGTFGWWAGWLANGTVVYWKDYALPNTRLSQQYSQDRKDYILPGWVGLS